MSVSALQWALDLQRHAGWPSSIDTAQVLVGWALGENTRAQFNPLATTQHMPGSFPLGHNPQQNNGHPVQEYLAYPDGLEAIVHTIRNGHYPTIERGLIEGSSSRMLSHLAEFNVWGTGGAHVLSLHHRVVADWLHYAAWIPPSLVHASGPSGPPPPPPRPPHPVTSTPIEGTHMHLSTVEIALDAGGNGYRQTAIPWKNFIAATHQGSNPDPHADAAYWPGNVHAQNRDGRVLVSVTGATRQAGGHSLVFVAHA